MIIVHHAARGLSHYQPSIVSVLAPMVNNGSCRCSLADGHCRRRPALARVYTRTTNDVKTAAYSEPLGEVIVIKAYIGTKEIGVAT